MNKTGSAKTPFFSVSNFRVLINNSYLKVVKIALFLNDLGLFVWQKFQHFQSYIMRSNR